MNKIKTITTLLVIFCISATLLAAKWKIDPNHQKPTDKAKTNKKGFAVVELFTSEGCSSCPAADAVVAKIQKENADLPVYILAFHVDYWNRLGWKDVFSDAVFSKRQNQYADWFKTESVYTPQIVVNGQKEFVGSQENTLRSTIKDDLQKTTSTTLSLTSTQTAQHNVSIKYAVENAAGNFSLVLAVLQKEAVTKVERGENKGRTLAHVQIVRGLQVIDLIKEDDGTAQVQLPAGFNLQGFELIGFVQNNINGEIVAAAKI